MTIDLDRIEAIARAATQGEWEADDAADIWAHPTGKFIASVGELDAWTDTEANAHYIATMSPVTILPLIEALKEWRDAYQAWANDNTDANHADIAIATRFGLANDALLALITKQETNNDRV